MYNGFETESSAINTTFQNKSKGKNSAHLQNNELDNEDVIQLEVTMDTPVLTQFE